VDLENALRELGTRLGLGEIKLDASGAGHLVFDNESIIDLQLAEDEQGFYLTSTIGEAPTEAREEVFSELLQANLQARGVGRCCLAYDAELNEIVLSRYFERNEIDVTTLEEELEHFLTVCEVWKRRLQKSEIGTLNLKTPEVSIDTSIPPHIQNMIRP
jgi:hypothetical protein